MHGKRKLPFCVLMRRFRFSVEFNRMTRVGSSMLNLEVWNYSRRKKPTVFLTPCKKGVGFTGTTNSSCFLLISKDPWCIAAFIQLSPWIPKYCWFTGSGFRVGCLLFRELMVCFPFRFICLSVEMCVWLQPALKKMLRLLGKVKKQHKDCCPVTLD